jgi:pimeloyl-ACP methyl ester carboxylesterase
MECQEITVGDVTLSVQTAGSEDAPVLVLLHGWPESARGWSKILPLLELEYRLIVPDQRGFGASSKPDGTSAYAMAKLVGDVVGLIEWSGVERVGVVGHDFGGAVAWGLGAFAPERVSRMVVMAAPHPLRMRAAAIANPQQWQRSFYVWLLHGRAGEALMARNDFKTLANWAFSEAVGPEEREAYRSEWRQAFHSMAEWYRANYRPELFDPAVPLELPPVRVPVRYLHAEHDVAFVPEMATGSGEFVDAEYDEQIVEGTSHWMVHERPGEIARLVRGWMSRA